MNQEYLTVLEVGYLIPAGAREEEIYKKEEMYKEGKQQ